MCLSTFHRDTDRRSTPQATAEPLEPRRLLSATPELIVEAMHNGGCSCWQCCVRRDEASAVTVDAGLSLTNAVAGRTGPWTAGPVASGTLRASLNDDEPTLRASQVVSFKARLNFQPETMSNVPARHRADTGREFGRRANGLSYGWNRDKSSAARVQNSARSPDGRYDSFINVSVGDAWEIAVPNGRYYVSVVAGDPDSSNSQNRLSAEGQPLMHGRPRGDYRWVEGAGYVDVNDGRLTLTVTENAQNMKLAFVQVIQAAPAVVPQTGLSLDWQDSPVVDPVGRIEPGVSRLGHDVYVLGGYINNYGGVTSRVDVLDTATNTWRRAADLPGPQSHIGVTNDGTRIYTAGGQIGTSDVASGTNAVYVYDPATDRWSEFVNLPQVRFAGALSHVDGFLYFFGGADAGRIIPRPDSWKLDLANPDLGWQRIAPMVRPADHLGSAVMNGHIYLLGGEHGHGVSYVQHDDVFRYDPVRDRHVRVASLPVEASHFEGNVVEHAGRLWVLGGRGQGNTRLTQVHSYDPVTDVWFRHTDMPRGRFGGVSWVQNDELFFSTGDVFKRGSPRETIRALLR